MCKLSAYVAFNKATNGQTDVKHDNDENVAECHCQWIVMSMWALRYSVSTERVMRYASTEIQYVSTERVMRYVSTERVMRYVSTERVMRYVSTERVMRYVSTERVMRYVSTERVMCYVSTEIQYVALRE